ncbi:Flagellar L-ring protein [Trichinella spiralis]|uniref:Flagellar L-ring protein n=1 Tax=Trichinella spiralis TaxID=6334 RepID=A0ABR3KQC3_TRISP
MQREKEIHLSMDFVWICSNEKTTLTENSSKTNGNALNVEMTRMVGRYFVSAESVGQEAINDSADLFVMVACITLSWRQVAATIDTFIIRQCKS